MITVYGRATSANVQLVMWMIGELGLDCERLDYGHSFGGLDTPEFLEMNPNGRVPAFRETQEGAPDLVMFEAGAIARYLAARYGTEPFWPADLVARARLDVWAEWTKVTLQPAFQRPVFWGLLAHPKGQGRAHVQAAAEDLKPLMKMLDDRIEGPWLGGADFTFADIWTGVILYRYMTLDFDKAETPALDAYYARLTDRPAYARHVMVDYEVLRLV